MTALLLLAGLMYGAPPEWSSTLRPCNSGIPGPAHMVLVGRNHAPASFGEQPLRYAVNDVRAMYQAAVQRMCFRPDQITVLTGPEATPAKLLAHLESLSGLQRLFVFISAHGKRKPNGVPGYLIGLAEPLDSEALRQRVEAVKARQTMVFLDTCNSAEALPTKGEGAHLTYTPQVAPGFFWLAAATGAATEDHRLRAGTITAKMLSLVHGRPALDSVELCHLLDLKTGFGGKCVTRHDQAPVVIVPPTQPHATVLIERPGVWSYLAFVQSSGFPLVALPNLPDRDVRVARLATGRYVMRRLQHDPARCQRAELSLRAGEVRVVEPGDWIDDPENCEHIKRDGIVVRRPRLGLWLAGGAGNGWVAGSALEARAQAGVAWNRGRQRVAAHLFASQSARENTDVPARERIDTRELGLSLSIDPLWLDAVDLYAGFEAGGAWTRAEHIGLTGLAAVRLGGVWRLSSGLQPEISARLGVRVYRQFTHSPLITVPWLGVMLGATVGLHHGGAPP